MKRRWLLGGVLALALLSGCAALPEGIDGNLADDWPLPAQPQMFRPADTGCFDTAENTAPLTDYAPYDCAERHVSEAYFVGDLPGDPSNQVARDTNASPAHVAAAAECAREATPFLGADWRGGRIHLQPVLPSDVAWAAGARWFRCDAAEVDLTSNRVVGRTGSLRGALAAGSPLLLGCVDPTVRGGRVERLVPVDCAKPHRGEYAGLWTASDVDFADVTAEDQMGDGCRSAIARFAGIPDDPDVRYRVGWLGFAPTRAQWDLGVRTVRCFLWIENKPMTGTYRNAGTGKLPINYA